MSFTIYYKDKGGVDMANREREIRLQLFVDSEEQEMIKHKMSQVGTNNFSAYARKMLIDGYVIRRDFSELKKLVGELGAIGRNINQIAKRANETRNIYEQDIKDLQRNYIEMKALINERLVKIIREDKGE